MLVLAEIGGKSGGSSNKKGIGSGKKTLRLKSKGGGAVEEVSIDLDELKSTNNSSYQYRTRWSKLIGKQSILNVFNRVYFFNLVFISLCVAKIAIAA